MMKTRSGRGGDDEDGGGGRIHEGVQEGKKKPSVVSGAAAQSIYLNKSKEK